MKVELLAPAGSYEALEAAFEAGADAVYLGGQKFGARAYADNLDQEQLIRAIDLAHLKGKQLYLTINTLLKTGNWKRNCTNIWLRFTRRDWMRLLYRIRV